MLTKIAIALALTLATATGSLAATKKHSINPSFDVYSTSGKYVGSDPDVHIRGALARDNRWTE
jgi:hypothetical protein